MAHIITLLRVIIALITVHLLQDQTGYQLFAALLIVCCLSLDALDGYIARRYQIASLAGSVADIVADRIVENIFFIFFALTHLISIWIAFFMMIRGLITDAVRTLFSYSGKTAFGESTLHTTGWSKFIACSRWSRGGFNVSKLLTFTLYALLLDPRTMVFQWLSFQTIARLAHLALWTCVGFALLRTLAVMYELCVTSILTEGLPSPRRSIKGPTT